jgi:eukaryotic-like serine/threonine-protein kinase
LGVLLLWVHAGSSALSRARAEAADARAEKATSAFEAAQATAELERTRAEQRAASVRQLTNVFLVDFHDAIEKLDGATRARELIVTKALEHLQALASEADDDPLFNEELAKAYERVGFVQGGPRGHHLGDSAGALASYRKALELREATLASNPDDSEMLQRTTATRTWVADMLRITGHIEAAAEQYDMVLDARQRLLERNPRDHNARRGFAIALLELGRSHGVMGNRPRALELYSRSLDIRRELLREQPRDPASMRTVSVGLNAVAQSHAELGDTERALELYLEGLALRQNIAEIEPDGRALRDVIMAHVFVGQTHFARGEYAQAREHAEAAHAGGTRRLDADPGDARAQQDLTLVCELLGDVAVVEHDQPAALRHFQRAMELSTGLVEQDAANTYYRRLAARSHAGVAKALAMAGTLEEAMSNHRAAVAILQTLVDADALDVPAREDLARQHLELGEIARRAGLSRAARAHLEDARRELRALLELAPTKTAVRADLARALQLLAELHIDNGEANVAAQLEAEARDVLGKGRPEA